MSKKEALFETIHQKYYVMISQMCLGFTKGDDDEANDLSQEVLIHIWNKLETYKGASSYKTWIYRITVNTCLQHIRKEKKRTNLPINEVEHLLIDRPETPSLDANKALYNAIGYLNELDRLVIMMVLDGQDQDLIADVLGIKPTNVRVKIHRIKKRLKKIVENEK